MQFLFDHTIAILVGATLLGGLFMLNTRGQQTAIEAAQRYRVQTQTAGFTQTVERDVENIRTEAQSEHAFGTYRFTLRQAPGGAYTEQATFVTLQDPSLGAASPAMVVSYTTTPTGRTIDIGGTPRPTYRVQRQTSAGGGPLTPDGGAEDVVDFDLTALMNDGSELTNRGGTRSGTGAFNNEVPSLPRAVRVEVVGATEALAQRTADQSAVAQTNASRQTRTVALVAYGTTGGLPPRTTSTPATMPPLPGDPPPPSPSPTSGSSGGAGSGGGGTTTTGGGSSGSTGGTGSTPPPPRPTPPAGSEI